MTRKKRIAFAVLAVLGSTLVCLLVLDAAVGRIQPKASYKKWYEASLTYLLDDDAAWKLNARAEYIGSTAHPGSMFDTCGALLPHLTDYVRMLVVQAAIKANKSENDRFWVDLNLTGQVQPKALAFYRDNRQRIARAL